MRVFEAREANSVKAEKEIGVTQTGLTKSEVGYQKDFLEEPGKVRRTRLIDLLLRNLQQAYLLTSDIGLSYTAVNHVVLE